MALTGGCMKKSVLLVGPILTRSGYGEQARFALRALRSREDLFDVYIKPITWGQTSWIINPESNDGLIRKIMERSKKSNVKPDVTFQVQLPDEWDPNLGKKNIGVSAVVETSRCNPKWIDCCNKMDHVIVPSEFSKKCLINSGLKSKRATVIPESFMDTCFDEPEELSVNFQTNRNFLMLGQMSGDWETDRKNTAQTIALFCDVFKNRPDVGLIVKTNSGRNSTVDRSKSKKMLN